MRLVVPSSSQDESGQKELDDDELNEILNGV
jgi:hypothetical protein